MSAEMSAEIRIVAVKNGFIVDSNEGNPMGGNEKFVFESYEGLFSQIKNYFGRSYKEKTNSPDIKDSDNG